MADVTLVLIEISRIQAYIFGSNHLAQNIGASEIVTQATHEWIDESIRAVGLRLGERGVANGEPVERVYAGGGAVMLLFADAATARRLIQAYTRLILKRAPGLDVVSHSHSFDWQTSSLAKVHADQRQVLAARKHAQVISTPLMGLAVTAQCVYTGQPVVGWDNDVRIVGRAAAERARAIGEQRKLVAAEVAAKLRYEDDGKERLHAALPQVRKAGFEFVYDFAHFGDRGTSSYIAVIHADVNRMGERFARLQEDYGSPQQNSHYVRALRGLSDEVKARANSALSATVSALLDSRKPDSRGHLKFGGKVAIPVAERAYRSKQLLPFRPLVFGGDDVTFVVDGRLGLALATRYLDAFTSGPLADGEPVTARAGVAIVKSHYPFARAYDMADDLTNQAKKAIPELKTRREDSATVLDWHIATSGVVLGLAELRQREYQVGDRTLHMRPIRLKQPTPPTDRWRSWDTLEKILESFQKDEWSGRRNKVKALRDALRAGPEAVSLFVQNYRLTKGLPDTQGGDNTVLFDAIEALDFYVPLTP